MKTCGLDVHKDIIFCAIYNGKNSVLKQFSSYTLDLREMCQYIKDEGIATVAMESTGRCIEAIRTVLRQFGMRAVVVNPFLIKQMPGRKSDVKDAEWIEKLHHKQMLSESQQICRLKIALEELDLYDRLIAEAMKKMEELTNAHYHEQARLLQTVPGIGKMAAMCIIAEIGTDMERFGSSGRLTGWTAATQR